MPTATCTETQRTHGRLLTAGPYQVPGLPEGLRLTVYLPPGYEEATQAYSLAVFFDGQNLFDDAGSFRGGWQLHRLLDYRACRGERVPVVVGLHTDGFSRAALLSPYPLDEGTPSLADPFLDWITGWLVPTLRTEVQLVPGAEGVLIGGSSLGGLMALYAFFRHPEQFGRAIVMSPSLGVAGGHPGPMYDYVRAAARRDGKLYLDAGGLECPCGHVLRHAEDMARVLVDKGYRPGVELAWHPDPTGTHDEEHWKQRLPGAVAFMCHGGGH